MRFCMVTTFYPPYHFGGDGVFVRALAQALNLAGHQVEVVHCEDAYHLQKQRRPIETQEADGIIVHRLRSRFGSLSPLVTQQTGKPGLKAAALRLIFNRDFDVVNFHNISLIGGPGILALSRAPLNLYTVHEHWLLCPMHTFWKNRREPCDRPQCLQCCIRSGIPPQLWRYTRLIEQSLGKIDLLLSPSQYTATRHREAGIRVPIRVLPSFTNIAPTLSPSRPARPYFLFAGRVTASKGIVSLIDEFSSLPDYDLWIAGDGDLRVELQTKYARCSNVRFLGAVPHKELVRLYGSATALVLPSLAPEVFPLSVLEAFACRTPAIVHNAGGSREAIDQTGGGVVYESTSDLRGALCSLAGDTTLRDDLGQRARKGYEHYYSQERYIEGYLGLIKGIQQKQRTLSGQ
jgi:glycosyltransferase involved in cell wall biosynthesis